MNAVRDYRQGLVIQRQEDQARKQKLREKRYKSQLIENGIMAQVYQIIGI